MFHVRFQCEALARLRRRRYGWLLGWTHALDGLLFLGAGSVLHSTGTRNMEEMGGLIRPMPVTAFCFLIGAIAISGLPPLNGFVSELLIYLGLFGTMSIASGAALAAPALRFPGPSARGASPVLCRRVRDGPLLPTPAAR